MMPPMNIDVELARANDVLPPRAVCDVSMAAVQSNVRRLSGALARNAELWAVVKANAYGHDVTRVAETVVGAGARRLCVATLSEALQLRRSGMRVPILVMGPLDHASIERARSADVDVTILSPAMVHAVAHSAANQGVRPLRVHLKVDTGMGRWGVPLDDAPVALETLHATAGVDVVGLMTHFATADIADDGGFFDTQLRRFTDLVATVRSRGMSIIAHAANSAATLRTPDAHFDAVRCGVAIYGLSPTQASADTDGLIPAMSLRSHVGDIRHLEPGESVGYGRGFIADAACRVALVPMGYADGVRRALSGCGEALIRGSRLPYVGTVSMDHLSLMIPDDMDIAVGDVVTIIGRDGDEVVSAENHAAWAGTINYEVTCGIAGEPRLQRRYDDDR